MDTRFRFNTKDFSKKFTSLSSFARKCCSVAILIIITVLVGIATFGATPTLIKSSTAVLKIDTRKATIHDILGGIEFLPIGSSATNTIRATSITRSITSVTTGSKTSTQPTSISTSSYSEAKSSLESLIEILKGIDSYVTVDDFSLARVFKIHDHLHLANGGFKCWSDNISRDHLNDVSTEANSCPYNGIMKCFGRSSPISAYYSSAYREINTDYLSATTSLDESDTDRITALWETILLAADPLTVRLNIDSKGYKAMSKFLCHDDYKYRNIEGGIIQKHFSDPYVLGLCSVILTSITLFVQCYSIRAGFVLWFISFALVITMFSLSFSSNIPTSKYINQSEGIRAKSAQGIVAFFVVIIILHLVVLSLFGSGFSRRKQKRYEAERERLNDIPLNNVPHDLHEREPLNRIPSNNPSPDLPPNYYNIIHEPESEQEPLTKVSKHELF